MVEASKQVVVGLLADPDLPSRLARRLGDLLADELARRIDNDTSWTVEVIADPFEAMYPDHDYLIDKARERVRDTEWDLALCLTDLPMYDEQGVVMAKVDAAHRIALISLPALGGIRLRRRLADLAVALTAALRQQGTPTLADDLAKRLPHTRVDRGTTDDTAQLRYTGTAGLPRLLGGMIRANRPWQLFVGLSTALAGALAGTAFGVLYSTIWQLATALGPWRLTAATIAALTTLTAWIVAGHGLWQGCESASTTDDLDRRLRNAGTLATVAVGATAFSAALYILALAAVALVVPPDYLAEVLHRPVRVHDYLAMALMATILGIIAGAVGSGLENDNTVRKAAYSHRERERRQRVEQLRRA
ncbi:hypothetical protein [Nocardia suismassiliense]|uniref:hypothetical protein n=1 Tax=Nocardia suismassiliense TaxID=2077092 RepID=UPI000D1F11E5|nr:hypothetical protein [Nocardia suismassiliense]